MTESWKTDEIEKRNEKYGRYVEAISPRTRTLPSLLKAFATGGLTCVIGELIGDGLAFLLPSVSEEMIATFTTDFCVLPKLL